MFRWFLNSKVAADDLVNLPLATSGIEKEKPVNAIGIKKKKEKKRKF